MLLRLCLVIDDILRKSISLEKTLTVFALFHIVKEMKKFYSKGNLQLLITFISAY